MQQLMIVALEQLVLRAPALNDIFDLDCGEEAERDNIGARWTRSKVEKEEETE